MVFGNKDLSDWCVHCYLGIIAYKDLSADRNRNMYAHTHTHTHTPTSMYLCLKHGFKLIMPILMAYFLFINVTPFTKKPWEIWLPLSSTYYFLKSSTCNQSPNYTGHILCPSLTKHSGCTGQILTLVSLTTSAVLAESSIYIEGK